jgi:hypothetical protein
LCTAAHAAQLTQDAPPPQTHMLSTQLDSVNSLY